MAPRTVAVVDIGKTNSKLALVDLAAGRELAVRKAPNAPVRTGPYPHHDTERLWDFILDGLAAFGREGAVDAVAVTTHGATAALVDEAGALALPVLDYEHDGPNASRADYARVRPAFAETGSPLLPGGLNLGAQLFWQSRSFPDRFARARAVLMYPQYWAFRLSGVLAGEKTSLGCHTDLWNPFAGDYSSLVDRLGWRALMPEVRPAADPLGTLLPEVAAGTGLAPDTPVLCGIHDSNASLVPHILGREPPFTVVSTGTWVVALAVGAAPSALDPARDTLVNVDAFGRPTPSARFMGGREHAALTAGLPEGWAEADLDAVLAAPVRLLPAVEPGSGPFQGCQALWQPEEPAGGRRRVASAFYLAGMTATALDAIGARGEVIVEGPLAADALFLRMLAAAVGRAVEASGDATGTSLGAAMLAGTGRGGGAAGRRIEPPVEPRWRAYAERWRAEAERHRRVPAVEREQG